MVIAPLILVLVARHPIVKRHLAGQAALGQQLQRAINRGKADPVVLLLHQAVELVGGEMIAGIQESTQDGVALSGVLQADALEMAVEDALGLAQHLARDSRLIINPFLQHETYDSHISIAPAERWIFTTEAQRSQT